LKKISGLPVPHSKNTAAYVPIAMPVPPEVVLPMKMHAGAPAKPLVAVGDTVKVGQLIGQAAEGRVSSPVHASVSGTVKSIDLVDSTTGQKSTSITITSDGKQTPFDDLPIPSVSNTAQFLEAVQNSGVVGLGGAGYPTAPKLTLKEGTGLDYILINGAECEPYITSDTRTMVDDAELVYKGMQLMQQYLKPKKLIICIESNKPEAIKKMQELTDDAQDMSVHVLPSLYPQGERKVLVYNVTERIVPEGGRLTDVGCIVINCTTVAVFAKYIETGMPMVSRIVTVDGSAVNEPKNVIVPIGTPIREVFAFCGGLKEDVKKVLLGGPMMGAAVPSLDFPVVKVINAVLAFSEKDCKVPEPTACIKCGRCIAQCPMKLMPSFIEEAFELSNTERLEAYKINMCAECACCEYICPSKRPLAQVMSLSKNMVWEARQK
jgi:electron transport complex protein RnfC